LPGLLWGVLMFIMILPALASMGPWQEKESLRNGQTRVWMATEIKETKNLFTGTLSYKTITHQYIEKADGLNYNAGTKAKPKWLPSVETITSTDDLFFPYEAKQGPYQVKFGVSINQLNPIEYSVGDDTICLGLKYLAYYDKTNNILKPLFSSLNHVNPIVEGNKVIYKEVAPGIDVEYVYQKGVFQQNIKVSSKSNWRTPLSYGISTDNAYLVAVTELDTTDFSTEFVNTKGEKMAQGLLKGKGCDILFKKKGNILCTLAPSLAFADTEKGKKEINQYRHIYQDGAKQYLLEGISYQELQSIEAPLTLDYEIKTGGISSNETWKEGNTYYISGELTVNSGATLVIEPGTICKYSTALSLNAGAGGRIIAKGDKYNYILMTSWKDNTMGESVSSSAGDPASGDYSNAIRLSTGSSSGSIIEYCKIRYAVFGLYDYDTNLTHPIQNNIMRDMYGAITLVGVSTCTVQNNLIDNCGFTGIYASSNSGYLSNAILVARNNTINSCAENGVRIEYNRFEDFSNNLITSCGTAMRVINYTFGNHSYNSFYGNNVLYVGTSGGTDETTLASTPYASSPNGSFYLDTAKTGCVNAGSTTARALGIDEKVTQVPLTVTADISTDTSWDKVPRDTGLVDRGYHYDPVDVVVGSSNKQIINIYSASNSANLRIYPGVVVSFWRSLSQNTGRIWLRNGKFVAHGHADDRIQFRNIFETGDMVTYCLGSGDSYGYSYGIEFGSYLEPESYAQFCEFHHACSGILLDPGIIKPMYRRFSDNIFNGCQYGITAIDAYLRAENNLFISNPKSDYQIYYLSTSSACDTAIVRNNSFIGNKSGDRGFYGYQGASSNDYMDIRNNIYTGFKEAAIKLDTSYFAGKISNNCYFNNSTNNIVSSISVESAIFYTPQFAWSTASSSYWNGYYLAQTTGDVSRIPLKGSYLDSTNGITVNLTNAPYYWSITAYTNPESGGSYPLGCYLGPSGYSDPSWEWAEYVSDPTGYISISILNAASQWTINDGDYITLNFQNGSNLKVYLPTATFPECGDPWDDSNDYLNLWVAEDGSAYYSYSGHTVTSTGVINQDASYAMNYDDTGLAKASFNIMGISTCVNSGDTTVRAYGSTASSYSKDSGKVDIGYHAKNPGYIMVGENGRQFEYEDGTPFVINGAAVLWASLEYQNDVTRAKFENYIKTIKNMGITSLTMCFHQNRCLPWGYENDAQTAWAVSTAKNVFSLETAKWFDDYLDVMGRNDMKVGFIVWQNYMGFNYNSPRDHYNPFFANSTIFHDGGAYSDQDVFTNSNSLDYQTTTLKWYVDRWGDRDTFIFWDPNIETDYAYMDEESLNTWFTNVHKYIKDYELQKYGHHHLVTASSGRPFASYYNPSNAIQMKSSVSRSIVSASGKYSASNVTNMDIQTTYFTNPVLDLANIHFGGYSTLSHPAVDDITQNCLWYPTLEQQWLKDSIATAWVSTTNHVLTQSFTLMTTGKRPYLAGLYYSLYYAPWHGDSTFFKDLVSECDNGSTLYASATILRDRHIDPDFNKAYDHYIGWALLAGGAAGTGYQGTEQVYNMFLPSTTLNGDPSAYYLNGQHTNYCLDTGYFNDILLDNLVNMNGREYNVFTDNMLKDKLALYKVMTCVNWNSRTWDNLAASGRINFSNYTAYLVYSGNSSNMLAYFCRDMRDTTVNYTTTSVTNMSVTFIGFPVYTPIRLTWFNASTGDVLSSTSFSEGSIQVTAPPFNRDIVAILKPE